MKKKEKQVEAIVSNRISVQDFIKDVIYDRVNEDIHITRRYIPIIEKDSIITNLLSTLFAKIEDGEVSYSEYDLDTNVIIDELFIKCAILSAYTDIDTSDRVFVYDTLSEERLLDSIINIIGQDASILLDWFYKRKSEKLQSLKDSQKSSLDTLLDELTNVVSTLPKTFDMAKLMPFVDKINSMKNVDERKVIKELVKGTKKNRLFGHLKPKKSKKVETPTSTEE